jgi:Transposase DNA-binding/Transposase DDE domain
MTSEAVLGSIDEEFEAADFGDVRLTERLMQMVRALDRAPDQSLAKVSKTVAAREAAYRFVENPAVTMEALLAPHLRATVARCRDAGTVYVVSDTTEFTFSGRARGAKLGRIKGSQRGFLGHAALAVDFERRPLGVLGIQPIVRDEQKKTHRNNHQQKKDPHRESLRWGAMVESVETSLGGVSAIHVMDREADIFELLSDLQQKKRRFVIRSGQQRSVVDGGNLLEAVSHSRTLLEREVQLSARLKPRRQTSGKGHPARSARLASLAISSTTVVIPRPKTTDSAYPESLTVNVVRVYEPEPPSDQPAIEWLLFTSEPVATAEQVAWVVDAYRARWLIEEYFKALKTGCAYEGRQLRSLHTLTNALGLLAVIAWRLLLLRALDRDAPLTPATDLLDPIVLEALAGRLKHIGERKPFPANPTVADVMKGIARLGGHHKSNGPPGWQLLWFGFQDLLMWSAGFIAGRSATSYDHS